MVEESLGQKVLLELAAFDKAETDEALRRIVKADAETLRIERVSWWSLHQRPRAIVCETSYELSTGNFTRGTFLQQLHYPRYFEALSRETLIAADDARNDPRTSEFGAGYLEPQGIGAMLDVPVWLGGKLAGVLCHEWVGPAHEWTCSEREFATSIGQHVATTLEVRQRTRAEEALRIVTSNERIAREEIRARDEFLSVASHELYTPLASLQLGLDALRTRKLAPDTADKTMALLGRQVQRLTQLVAGLLDVSRVQTGQLRLEREKVDLVELALEVSTRFSMMLAASGTELRIVDDGPVVGSWDRSRIDQVITNLLSNAAKFGRGAPIVLAVESRGTFARLTVRDEGIGIAHDQLPRIFERFERAVSSRSYGGLGLGLYILRAIVEAHGGRVSVESKLGSGTKFTVDLPLLAASPLGAPS